MLANSFINIDMVSSQSVHNACLEMLDGLSMEFGTCLHSTPTGYELQLKNDTGLGTMKCVALDSGVSTLIFDVLINRSITFSMGGVLASPIAHYLFIYEGKISHQCIGEESFATAISNAQCGAFKSDQGTMWSLKVAPATRLRMVIISVDMQRNRLINYFGSDKSFTYVNDRILLRYDYPARSAVMLKRIFSAKAQRQSSMLHYKVALLNLLSNQLSPFKPDPEYKRIPKMDHNRKTGSPPVNS